MNPTPRSTTRRAASVRDRRLYRTPAPGETLTHRFARFVRAQSAPTLPLGTYGCRVGWTKPTPASRRARNRARDAVAAQSRKRNR